MTGNDSMDGRLGRALGVLLDSARLLKPDDLTAAAAKAARELGVDELVLYVASHAQTELVPLGGAPREVLEIDATLPGRAFQFLEVLTGEAPGGAPRVWVPLLDGTERLGLAEYDLAPGADLQALLPALEPFTTLVSELVLTKGPYGDVIEAARRRRPMALSAEVLNSLLPPGTFGTERFLVSGLLEPSYEVAGDAFDYAVRGDRLLVAIFDAMGHGIEATSMAALALSAFRNARHRHAEGGGLLEIHAAVDTSIAEMFSGDAFVTAVLAHLDESTGRFCWLSAGHLPPLLVRGGRVVARLETEPFLPLGLGGPAGRVGEVDLHPRDRVLLLTDGVVEARAEDGSFFGEDRLVDFIERETASGMPVPETMRRLRRSVLAHQGGKLQDDATLLLIEWNGVEPDLTLPGEPPPVPGH